MGNNMQSLPLVYTWGQGARNNNIAHYTFIFINNRQKIIAQIFDRTPKQGN